MNALRYFIGCVLLMHRATQQPIMDSRRLSLDEVIALLERPQVQGADDAMEVVTPGSDDEFGAEELGEGDYGEDDYWDGM